MLLFLFFLLYINHIYISYNLTGVPFTDPLADGPTIQYANTVSIHENEKCAQREGGGDANFRINVKKGKN